MKAFFRDLFEYNHHCNQRLITRFTENPEALAGKALQLFSHILNAHHIWNNRIDPQHALFQVWEIHPVHRFGQIDTANFDRSLSILDRLGFDDLIDYTTSGGKGFKNDVRSILFHIINHSTYHRAQIATECRLAGLEPLLTDYIAYKR